MAKTTTKARKKFNKQEEPIKIARLLVSCSDYLNRDDDVDE